MHNQTDAEGRDISLSSIVTVSAILYWLVIIWYAITQGIPRPQYTIFFIGAGIILYVLTEIEEIGEIRFETVGLTATIAVVGGATTYLLLYFNELFVERPITTYMHEYVIAIALVITILYLAYREFGLGFLTVALVAIVFSYLGPYLPGMWSHVGLSPTRLLDTMVLNIGGFYGEISRIVAAWVALFLLYAGLLRSYGAFELVMRGAVRAANLLSSGVAQSAVIASMVIGSINGAQTANAAMTGSFTIPMMKDSGLPGRVSGAIEAVSSSGGQVMPPVMGSGAFAMAAILGVTYVEVLVAGLIPASIFFITVAVAVHFTVMRYTDGLSIDANEYIDQNKSRRDFTVDLLKFGIPFGVLIYLLGVLNWTVLTSALITSLLMIVCGILFPILDSVLGNGSTLRSTVVTTTTDTVEGFRYGAVVLAPIALIIALINGIVDLLMATGTPGMISLAIMDLSGGILIVAALLAMILCFIMGMGMPTVAAYTLVAILVAPTFTGEFNTPTFAAHYFVFYSAILSGITPPIAIAVVVTSGIARSDFWYTCLEAIRIGATLFIVPIAFLFKPQLVVGGITAESLSAGIVVLMGALIVIYGMNFVRAQATNRILGIATRGVYILTGSVVMIHPSLVAQAGALTVFIAIYLLQNGLDVNQITTTVTRKYQTSIKRGQD